LVQKDLPSNAGLPEILKAVWSNEIITSQCPNLVIRLTSLRGEVSKAIWSQRGKDPEQIQILAVGTCSIPSHLNGYHAFLNNYNAKSVDAAELRRSGGTDFVIGYDLLSKGDSYSRRIVLQMFNRHYGFPLEIIEKCFENSAITCGGMRGLKDLADSLVLNAQAEGSVHRFIQPDNSFGTWWTIIEAAKNRMVPSLNVRREIFSIGTKPENKLHLTASDVVEHYKKQSKSKK